MIENENKLIVHHIGARSGTRGFPSLCAFENDIVNVLYDADVDCIEQIKNNAQKTNSTSLVYPYCISDKNKTVKFNFNYDPYTNSIYPFNDEYKNHYLFYSDHDYPLCQTIKTMETRQLNTNYLDDILCDKKINIPHPDFLSMDVQGAEYDILKGANKTLNDSILGILLEAELHPIYKDQKIFGDIVKLLSEYGFMFIRFEDIQEMSPYRAPIGLRGKGIQFSSDALFLKKPDFIQSRDSLSIENKNLLLTKLAFISIAFNQVEHAIDCLEKRSSQASSQKSEQSKNTFDNFINKFELAVKSMPPYYPKTFNEKYTYQQSKDRFSSKPINIEEEIEPIPQILLDSSPTPVEEILLEYDLSECADLLKNIRLNQSKKIIQNQTKKQPEYIKQLLRWHQLKAKGFGIEEFFADKNINSLSLYGAGEVGQILIQDLKQKIDINYILDCDKNIIGKSLFGVDVIDRSSKQHLGDAIIVTVLYSDDELIRKYLLKEGITIPVYTMREILASLWGVRKKVDNNDLR